MARIITAGTAIGLCAVLAYHGYRDAAILIALLTGLMVSASAARAGTFPAPLDKQQLPAVTAYTDATNTFSVLQTMGAGAQFSSYTPDTNGQIGYNGTNILLREGGANKMLLPAVAGAGGIVYDTGSGWARLAPDSGKVLQSNGASAPTWVAPSGGSATLLGSLTARETIPTSYGWRLSTFYIRIPANTLAAGDHVAVLTSFYADSASSYATLRVGGSSLSNTLTMPTTTTAQATYDLICRSTGGSGSLRYAMQSLKAGGVGADGGTVSVNTTAAIDIYFYIYSSSLNVYLETFAAILTQA